MSQLSLFKPQICYWCGKDPGADARNAYLWNGFRDTATGNRVCFKCRKDYYNNNKTKPNNP